MVLPILQVLDPFQARHLVLIYCCLVVESKKKD